MRTIGRHPKVKKGVTIEEVERAIVASGGLLADAARMLGISRSTLDARVARSDRLTALVIETRAKLTDFCKSRLVQGIEQGNLDAICFYLRHTWPRGRAVDPRDVPAELKLVADALRLLASALERTAQQRINQGEPTCTARR